MPELGRFFGIIIRRITARTFTLTIRMTLRSTARSAKRLCPSIPWRKQQPDLNKSRRVSRLTLLIFLGVCVGYFELCKTVGLVMGWTFLVGFLPSWPFALQAARSLKQDRRWLQAFWSFLAFSAYFWSSGLFPTLKTSLSE